MALIQRGGISSFHTQVPGHGWSSSATQQIQVQPDQPIQPGSLPGHLLVQEVVRPVPGGDGTLYAAGEPITVDVSSNAAWRSSNDLFGMQTDSNGYEAQSLVPAIDEVTLRTAGQNYPGWIARCYLALPQEVPARVKELVIQLTAAEPTPYDRASAVEAYLRKYPYTLDVTRPPANQDLVDFFLFDLCKGYCDYYASAMVVLARAAGIPARLAIGYTSGTYNENSKRFIVTQADAHSWVEVYFPGIGWVPFESTAAQPLINRSTAPAAEAAPTPTFPVIQPGAAHKSLGRDRVYLGLGLVFMAGIMWAVVDEIHLQRMKSQPLSAEIYRRMKRYGNLMRLEIEPGDTLYEVSALLSREAQTITHSSATPTRVTDLGQEIQRLIHRIVRLNYRPVEVEAVSESKLLSQWRSLRWRLRAMWLAKHWQAVSHQFHERLSGCAVRQTL